MFSCMDNENFDYDAAEEIYDTLNIMSAPYQDEIDTQCNYKGNGTTYYSNAA